MNELAARSSDSSDSPEQHEFEPVSSQYGSDREQPDLGQIFRQHAPRVWRTLRALGVHEASVDDAAQDVFLVVNQRLSEFEGRALLSTWIYSITYRVAQAYRRKALRHRHTEYEDTVLSANLGPAEAFAEAQAAQFVREFCSKLSEAKRDVFVLCVLEERSAPEVVTLLGVNLSTVYSRLRAVKIDFRQALQRQTHFQAAGSQESS